MVESRRIQTLLPLVHLLLELGLDLLIVRQIDLDACETLSHSLSDEFLGARRARFLLAIFAAFIVATRWSSGLIVIHIVTSEKWPIIRGMADAGSDRLEVFTFEEQVVDGE